MHGLHHVKGAFAAHALFQEGVKAVFLLPGRHGHGCFENRVYESLMVVMDVAGIEEGVVDVGSPVVKGGEEKAGFRRADKLALHGTVEALLLCRVAQGFFAGLYGADAAEHVFVYVSAVFALIIAALLRDVIGVAGHEDEIVVFAGVYAVDDAVIKALPQVRILQLALPEGGEQAVLLAVHHLLCGEGDIQQVFAESTGERLFQEVEIDFGFGAAENADGFFKFRDDLPVGVDIASVDAPDVVVIRPDSPPDLAEFFLIHESPLLCSG